ncbi:butyrate kinase [Aquimarina sp. EL_43]|uniref:hypothetical protein n=1 Tax=Aquimarina TaxID=290174 RepID=UPI0004728045|nr:MULTISPECIES: hypothetical protein [Aquimarina]MBG6129895.1 butyrate kinase [Aquimarina sp. EL_35]MBG6150960.1 butyrate kinase [Aquimarina sp. EL_32]MBG6167733.1 butyrate kinase [Aquimarina sp. EL_43]
MSTDKIEKLFKRMQDQLDIHEPSANHQIRFLEKLQQQNKVVQLQPKKVNWYTPLAIAASIAIVFGMAAMTFMFNPKEEVDLANVSPQMKETQSFFTSAIQLQLEEIDKVSSAETKELVLDAMNQLEKLESDYEILKKDLFHSGNDKRVISAMIKNFQKRANLLEEVLQKINSINEFKLSENENFIL